jgi:hypothetical protein
MPLVLQETTNDWKHVGCGGDVTWHYLDLWHCVLCKKELHLEPTPFISGAPSGPRTVGPPDDGETAPEDRSNGHSAPLLNGEDEAIAQLQGEIGQLRTQIRRLRQEMGREPWHA